MYKPQYFYIRERREFGRQCLFSDHSEILFSEPTNEQLFKDYIQRNPVTRSIQATQQMAWSEMITENTPFLPRGILHEEGGWPKDVNYKNEQLTSRHKKKVQWNDNWKKQVLQLAKPTIAAISQNSAVNIYEEYFEELEKINTCKSYSIEVTDAFRFIAEEESGFVPVSQISWAPNHLGRMVVGYGYREFLPQRTLHGKCYIWEIDRPNLPLIVLNTLDQVTSVQWNVKDENFIGYGLDTGVIGIWDQRTPSDGGIQTQREKSQRECVTSFCWVYSKGNSEFLTSSTDGSIFWWDSRKISQPLGSVLLDPVKDEQNRSRSHSCSILEYDFTIPTRFMAGSSQGYLFLGNRKGTTPSEIIYGNFRVMSGPVYSLERNPFYTKNFLVVGDWCAKIWTDECKENPLIWTANSNVRYLCGAWSKSRPSLYFIGREDGVLEFRDIILDHEAIIQRKLGCSPITTTAASDDGVFVAAGTKDGEVNMIRLKDDLLHNERNERALLASTFERETHRNKLLEARFREIKLQSSKKQEEEMKNSQTDVTNEDNLSTTDEPISSDTDTGITNFQEVKQRFLSIIEEEIERRKQKQTTHE